MSAARIGCSSTSCASITEQIKSIAITANRFINQSITKTCDLGYQSADAANSSGVLPCRSISPAIAAPRINSASTLTRHCCSLIGVSRPAGAGLALLTGAVGCSVVIKIGRSRYSSVWALGLSRAERFGHVLRGGSDKYSLNPRVGLVTSYSPDGVTPRDANWRFGITPHQPFNSGPDVARTQPFATHGFRE